MISKSIFNPLWGHLTLFKNQPHAKTKTKLNPTISTLQLSLCRWLRPSSNLRVHIIKHNSSKFIVWCVYKSRMKLHSCGLVGMNFILAYFAFGKAYDLIVKESRLGWNFLLSIKYEHLHLDERSAAVQKRMNTCMIICRRCIQVIALESQPLLAHISIMAWITRILWSNTDFKSVA